MAISVDWGTSVIFIPRADMQLVQSTPVEIRQLDIEAFRLTLKALEDDEGITYSDTHSHNTVVTLGGVTFARLVEILPPYTVTFEDGLYQVNLVGANSNIADRTNPNSVGVRSSNSAGLTYSKEVEDQSYTDARVWIDTVEGLPGTQFPRGTPGSPVDNLDDALQIIATRGFPHRLRLEGVMVVQSGQDLSGFDILGSSPLQASLYFDTTSLTDNLVTEGVTVDGDLSGPLTAKGATSFATLVDFEGTMINSGLQSTLYVADNATVLLDSCYSEAPGAGRPIVYMGQNSVLMLRNFSGGLEIRNMTAGCIVSADLDPGTLYVGPTNVGGQIQIRGTGTVQDTSNGTEVLTTGLVDSVKVTESWQRLGLDPNAPVTATTTQVTFSNVIIDLTGNGQTNSTATRRP